MLDVECQEQGHLEKSVPAGRCQRRKEPGRASVPSCTPASGRRVARPSQFVCII